MQQVQPPICNRFVAPGCLPFPDCGYPVVSLSNNNKRELVDVLVWLHRRYEHDKSPKVRRQIHAMQKVLNLLGIEQPPSRESGENNGNN